MNISALVNQLKQQQVIAYPTEAVFGLGCDPRSQSAVEKLLFLKQRSVDKGLILIAPSLGYLRPYIDESQLSASELARLQQNNKQAITWIVPAKADTPKFLIGQFSSIAIRICNHPAVKLLCEQAGFALTSTSANLSGLSPCRTAQQVRAQFGADFPVLDMEVGGSGNPSEIRDLITNQIIREG